MINAKLAAKLIKMSKADQLMRTKAANDIDFWDDSIDIRHTNNLKSIIAAYGWPTISLVGTEAANAAWLIAQHADHDVAFQEECLNLISKLPEGEVLASNIAYLEDRVRTARGRPQLYATQFDNLTGKFGPKAVEDRVNLDKRRKRMGLEPFEIYRKRMIQFYK